MTERRSFIRFYAVGPSEDVGKLNVALDDFLVDRDWPESIDWARSCEAADGWLIDLLQDMREGNTKLLRPVEARVDDSGELAFLTHIDAVLAMVESYDDNVEVGKCEGPLPNGLRRNIGLIRHRIGARRATT